MWKTVNIGASVLVISLCFYIFLQKMEDSKADLIYHSSAHAEKRLAPIVYPIVHDGWELIWRDEFEGDTLNEENWNYENWASEKNNELQYYHPTSVIQADGYLKIISKQENFKGRDYVSGAVHTKDLISFLYGKVEMRAKLPTGQGIFPAFWMMPNLDQTWLPEIDIMEMVGHKPNEIWMVLHWKDEGGKLKSKSNQYLGPDYSKDFHTFGIEWTPEQISWFIDDELRYQENRYVPDVPMYVYLNTAIGGNWPKSPDETTLFPQTFIVDYVRVYQKRGG